MTDRVFYYSDVNPDGWTVARTLTLNADGTFVYDEAWGSYGGSAEWSATGTYDIAGDVVTLHVVGLSRDTASMFQQGATLSAALVDVGAVLVLDSLRLDLLTRS